MKCNRQIFGFQSRGGSNELGKTEAARGGVLFKKVFCLKRSQIFSWKYLRCSAFFNKVAGQKLATFLKKNSKAISCFLVNFVNSLRLPFLQNTSRRLLFEKRIISTLFIAEGTSQHGFRYHLNVLCNIINTTEFWFWGKISLPLPLH